MANYIVLRESPDWQHFDIESSRAFCKRVGLPETTIVDFAEIWDRHLRMDYRAFRHRVKEIAVSTFARVRNSTLIGSAAGRDFSDIGDDDRVAFTDDDDWFSSSIFDLPTNEHGIYWGSARLGRSLGPTFAHGGAGMLTLREIEPFLYTNNYIVTGAALRTLGLAGLTDHGHANQCFQTGGFRPQQDFSYSSCANKSPASAVSARYLLSLDEFRRDPLAEFREYRRLLEGVEIPDQVEWIRQPLAEYTALVAEATPQEV